MEEDGDLTINLNTEGQSSWLPRPKVVGNRSQRIRARKAANSRKYENDIEQPSETVDEEIPRRPKNVDFRRRTEHAAIAMVAEGESNVSMVTRHTAPIIHVSSLFTKNPAIPYVPKTAVETVKEKVFSSGSFGDLGLHPFMVSNVEGKMGLKQTTSVQCRSIPILLAGNDALIKSQTGSGKTLAYAVPLVQSLQSLTPKVKRSDGPYAIILVPTRELAIQSYDTFQKLVQPFVWLVAGCIIGGEKRKAEKARLRKGINILVATPGRLLDHIEHTNCLNLARIRWLILDEADRLLDMGYEKAVAKIVTAMNARQERTRQTVMLSATLSDGVERLAGITLNSPERISVTEVDEKRNSKTISMQNTICDTKDHAGKSSVQVASAPPKETFTVPEKLKQHYVIVPCKLRLVTLTAFVLSKVKYSSMSCKMIVFLSTQDSVEFHCRMFDRTLNPKSRPATLDSYPDRDVDELSKHDDDKKDIPFFKLHGEMQQKKIKQPRPMLPVILLAVHSVLPSSEELQNTYTTVKERIIDCCDQSKMERTEVYQQFSQSLSGVLFCTDVAARGLDLPNVRWIVQYSSPGGATEYVHRVGRTARAGGQGRSLLFLMPNEVNYIKTLNSQHISLSELSMTDILKTMALYVTDLPKDWNNRRDLPHGYEEAATFVQLNMEDQIQEDKEMSHLSRKAYQSFVRGYATYPAHLKSIFHVKNLHLGHVAKSFALREAPKDVGMGFSKIMAATGPKRKKPNKMSFREDDTDVDHLPRKKQKFLMSEFGSGSIIHANSPQSRKPFSGPGVKKRKKKMKS